MASSTLKQGMVIVIMGVSGAGKSTIGEMLAKETSFSFIDADDFHSKSNKEKMGKGIPLSEEDRIPWLETLGNALRDSLVNGRRSVILGCSALQKRYREVLRSADPSYEPGSYACVVKFVLLDAEAHVLAARLAKRAAEGEHFMPPELLQSQLDLLQIDDSEEILKVDANLMPQDIVNIIHRMCLCSNAAQNNSKSRKVSRITGASIKDQGDRKKNTSNLRGSAMPTSTGGDWSALYQGSKDLQVLADSLYDED